MKKIAALTMARNDDFYLRKWVEYYGGQLGKENLYIYLDGLDQVVGDYCEGTHAQAVEKIGNQLVAAEKGRLKFLSEKAAGLLASGYDLVIGVDADEFVVVDPKLGKTLPEYLSSLDVKVSVSALGVDFGQKLGEEADITEDRPFLQQYLFSRKQIRRHGRKRNGKVLDTDVRDPFADGFYHLVSLHQMASADGKIHQ